MAATRDATLCLVNEQRVAAGLPALTSQPQIEGVATQYSQAMVDRRFFDHTSPSGENLQQRLAGYLFGADGWSIGENIAWGEGPTATPAVIVGGWMHSAGHRANILSSEFREIGIGIVSGTPTGSAPASSATYTTDFGARDGASVSITGPASAPARGGPKASAGAASAAVTTADAPRAPRPQRISAAGRRRITAQCARIVRRQRASPQQRRAVVARCVRTNVRAAGYRE